jgi:acyl-coenzyme A thioesterase PaaI-like protein
MDATAPARSLLEPVPAHRTAGTEVLRAEGGAAEVALDTPPELTDVIGSLHSSGLIALLDAAGPAAVIAAVQVPGEFDGVVPLGAAAASTGASAGSAARDRHRETPGEHLTAGQGRRRRRAVRTVR